METNSMVFRILRAILIFAIFFLAGRISVQIALYPEDEPIAVIEDINRSVPVVEILELKDGILRGKVNEKSIRIKAGKQLVVASPDQSFELSLSDIGLKVLSEGPILGAPDHAQFVASKRGKYFYALDSASAKKLSPKNLVFFQSEDDALKAGYKKRDR